MLTDAADKTDGMLNILLIIGILYLMLNIKISYESYTNETYAVYLPVDLRQLRMLK